jgi:hypothetical protein
MKQEKIIEFNPRQNRISIGQGLGISVMIGAKAENTLPRQLQTPIQETAIKEGKKVLLLEKQQVKPEFTPNLHINMKIGAHLALSVPIKISAKEPRHWRPKETKKQ